MTMTACPACCGARQHEKACPARSLAVAWPSSDADDRRAAADRLHRERIAAYAARHPA